MRSIYLAAFLSVVFIIRNAHSQPIHTLESVDAQIAGGNYYEAERRLQYMYTQALQTAGVPTADRNRLALRYAELQLTFGLFNEASQTLARRTFSDPAELAIASWLNGRIYYGLGRYPQAQSEYSRALGEARAAGSQLLIGRIQAGLSDVQRASNNFSNALENINSAVQTLQSNRAPLHELADALSILGDLQSDVEDYQGARKSYAAVLALFSKQPAARQPGLARALLGSSELALKEGNLTDSKKLWADASKGVTELLEHPVSIALSELEGLLALAENRLREARFNLTNARDSLEHNVGKDHPDYARVQESFAMLLRAEGDRKAAIEQIESAMRIYSSKVGENSLQMAQALTLLGLAQSQESMLTRAAEIRSKILGPKSVAVAESNLAMCQMFVAGSNWTRAEPVCRSAMTGFQDRLQGRDVRLQASMRFLGVALSHDKGGSAEAERLLRSWLSSNERPVQQGSREAQEAKLALGEIYLSASEYGKAQEIFESLLSADLQASGRANILLKLANAQFKQQKYGEATVSYEAAIKAGEIADNADTYRNLGFSYAKERQYARAAEAYRKALAAYDKAGSAGQPQANLISLELAAALIEAGHTSDAETPLNRWLSGLSTPASREAALDLTSFNRIVDILLSQKKYAVAEGHLRTLLEALVSGRDSSPHVADVLVRLATVTAASNKPVEAAQFYLRRAEIDRSARKFDAAHRNSAAAVAILEKSGKVKDEWFVSALNQLGRNYLDQRKYFEAEIEYRRSKDILAALPNKYPVELAKALTGLGRVEQATSREEAAAAHYTEAEALIAENAEAPASLVAELAYSRGTLALNSNKLDEASTLYAKAFEVSLKSSGGMESDQMDGMVQLYLRQQRYAEAEQLYLRLLEVKKSLFGSSSVEYAWALHSTADFYMNRKDVGKAIEYGTLALRTFETLRGPESEEVQAILSTLAAAYRTDRKLEQAVELQLRVLAMLEKRETPNRVNQQMLLTDLAESYTQLNDLDRLTETYERTAKLWETEGFRNPNYRRAKVNLMTAHLKSKHPDRAQELFTQIRKSIKGQTEENQLLQDYSAALASNGYVKESQKILREIRKK